MNPQDAGRPARSEYSGYYAAYIDLVPHGEIIGILAGQNRETVEFLGSLGEEKGRHRYRPGKWSIKQVVGHLIDVEWVYTYRGLCFARGDGTHLPGMDQDAYVAAANFDARKLADLCGEFAALREANVALFKGLTPEEMMRMGKASDFHFTVRAIPYILAGHERHHVGVIRERYL